VDDTASTSHDSPMNPAHTAHLDITQSKAAGLITYVDNHYDVADQSDFAATWSSALDRWSRDAETYGVVVRPRPGIAAGSLTADAVNARRAFYTLIWRQDCFFKPTATLLSGPISLPSMALAVVGTHRVADRTFQFALPAAGSAAGLGGLAHIYSAMPSSIGIYLALTGTALSSTDAHRLGLVTHCIDGPISEVLTDVIANADPVDEFLDQRHRPSGPASLAPNDAIIARCFSANSIDEIHARLDRERASHGPFVEMTKHALNSQNPGDLALRLSLLQRAALGDLRSALIADFEAATPSGTAPLALISRHALQAPHT
jgi:enoyl-CoA hydratase/carnithine racemase